MAHTYSKVVYHIVWSTKNRELLIDGKTVKEDLYAYIKGIIEKQKGMLYAINGMPDHVHLLLSLPLTVIVPYLVQQIKISSTKWMRGQFQDLKDFSWQEGCGVFSVGLSNFEAVKNYILRQEEHHKTRTFEDEYLDFLQKMNITYDKRFVLG